MIELVFVDIDDHVEHWFVLFSLDYSHVWAIKAASNGSIVVEPGTSGLFVTYVDEPVDELLAAVKSHGAHILIVDAHFSGYIPRGLQTCVSVVKSLLGLRAWHIITPRQLFNYLTKKGSRLL